jgi:putative DNA primase/helicase
MASTAGQFTDPALAEQLAQELQDRFVHVHGLGWLEWDGRRWAEVPDKRPREVIRAWFRDQLRTAAAQYALASSQDGITAGDLDRLHAAAKAWQRAQGISRLKAALLLAEGLLTVHPDQLDANPDLLNVQNGVVHLPTSELLEHRPDYYLTKIADCDYSPTAIHADWTAALNALPVDVQNWLQVRYGQGITGHTTPDDKVIIQQGGGANGKSTVLAGVAAALGDYYFLASDKILMGSQSSAHTTDLADLRGRRFVSIEETPEAGRLDVVRLKKLAGTERITARKMHQDNVSFAASHTLFVNTNYPPVVSETDDGTWRRLLLVVFPYTFTRDPQGENERFGDPGLRERLRVGRDGQREAVLGWLVEGATRWYDARREYPAPPESVVSSTAEWKDRTDHVAAFWADHLDPNPGAYVWVEDLIQAFNTFMAGQGNARVSNLTFERRFVDHPVTAGSMVRKVRMRQDTTSLHLSRPHGSLDPFTRLPEVPPGQIRVWIGLSFRGDRAAQQASVPGVPGRLGPS